jgi:hypothetical protein
MLIKQGRAMPPLNALISYNLQKDEIMTGNVGILNNFVNKSPH